MDKKYSFTMNLSILDDEKLDVKLVFNPPLVDDEEGYSMLTENEKILRSLLDKVACSALEALNE
jgi:hypothetical protein